MKNLFDGKRISLCMQDPDVLARSFTGWDQDSEYARLLSIDPAGLYSLKQTRDWFEKDEVKQPPESIMFLIRLKSDNCLLGFVSLWGFEWSHGNCWVSIGLGDRTLWGQGYGSEAMNLVLDYAFEELNMQRVSLGVFDYNPRGIRSYEKCGFKIEGQIRRRMQRDGRRWDEVVMGILRSEWSALQAGSHAG